MFCVFFCLFIIQRANEAKPAPDPKACNWKKYKYIVLNPFCAANIKEEEPGAGPCEDSPSPNTDRMDTGSKATNDKWPKSEQEVTDR